MGKRSREKGREKKNKKKNKKKKMSRSKCVTEHYKVWRWNPGENVYDIYRTRQKEGLERK